MIESDAWCGEVLHICIPNTSKWKHGASWRVPCLYVCCRWFIIIKFVCYCITSINTLQATERAKSVKPQQKEKLELPRRVGPAQHQTSAAAHSSTTIIGKKIQKLYDIRLLVSARSPNYLSSCGCGHNIWYKKWNLPFTKDPRTGRMKGASKFTVYMKFSLPPLSLVSPLNQHAQEMDEPNAAEPKPPWMLHKSCG